MNLNHTRCHWVNQDPLYIDYHDQEWGVPIYDSRLLFEFLILEGAQAGLSWLTILKRREGYRKAFDQFDAEKIAHYDQKKFEALMGNADIIRNRLKIQATISNAQALLQLQEQGENFSDYIWQFADGRPLQTNRKTFKEVPACTPLSDKLSKDLKKKGFKFVGSTICYAFMQAVGIVNDHTTSCFRHNQVKKL